jgi:uncharacterized protein YjbJ (UPF0337 family)
MGELIDRLKGMAKEMGGKLSHDRRMEAEGKVDQAKGQAKGAFEDGKQAAKDLLRDESSRR